MQPRVDIIALAETATASEVISLLYCLCMSRQSIAYQRYLLVLL